jgi:hypothetical protein
MGVVCAESTITLNFKLTHYRVSACWGAGRPCRAVLTKIPRA